MTTHVSSSAFDTGRPDPLQNALASLGKHWGWVLAYGALTVLLGIMVLAWPGATLLVIAVLFAAQLLVSGAFHIVTAFAADATGGERVFLGILGALAILVGLLCLRAPLQTVVLIALFIGAWWVVSGIVELVTAIFGGDRPGRIWRIAMGVLSIVAGVFVYMQPGISIAALTFALGVWLILYGLLAVAAAFHLRSAARRLSA